jgi:hypothetical protein
MTTETTDQGEQHVLAGTPRLTERAMLERRMAGPARATKPQRRIEGTDLWAGTLPPHQDKLL